MKIYPEFQKSTEIGTFDLQYMALGLGGEVGEVQNEIKKYIRDDKSIMTPNRKKKIMTELGDTMWYLTGICRRLGCSLNNILEMNMEKLSKNKKIETKEKPKIVNIVNSFANHNPNMMESEF
jgi:NTP pyrophosphatase (non-canonical NTP hydrolase)